VVITTVDGKRYEEYLEFPKGDPREPMTMEDIEAKFKGLSAALLSEERQEEIKESILSCDAMDTRKFMSLLTVK